MFKDGFNCLDKALLERILLHAVEDKFTAVSFCKVSVLVFAKVNEIFTCHRCVHQNNEIVDECEGFMEVAAFDEAFWRHSHFGGVS